MRTETPKQAPDFAKLLQDAVNEPGTVSEAFRAFHRFSIGNQLLAREQCHARGLQPGPIATFPGWKDKGRHVKKGEKALALCMPVTCKRTETTDEGNEEQHVFTRFVFRNNWFVLSQTEGEAVEPEPLPKWDYSRALAALNLTEEPFTHTDGNCLGYAKRGGIIAVSPLAPSPYPVRFHELGHQVLGHLTDAEKMQDDAAPSRNIRELEAEAVTLLVCAALELPGIEESRGYIQSWYGRQPIPEKNAQRIMKAADAILKAGQTEEAREERAA